MTIKDTYIHVWSRGGQLRNTFTAIRAIRRCARHNKKPKYPASVVLPPRVYIFFFNLFALAKGLRTRLGSPVYHEAPLSYEKLKRLHKVGAKSGKGQFNFIGWKELRDNKVRFGVKHYVFAPVLALNGRAARCEGGFVVDEITDCE